MVSLKQWLGLVRWTHELKAGNILRKTTAAPIQFKPIAAMGSGIKPIPDEAILKKLIREEKIQLVELPDGFGHSVAVYDQTLHNLYDFAGLADTLDLTKIMPIKFNKV